MKQKATQSERPDSKHDPAKNGAEVPTADVDPPSSTKHSVQIQLGGKTYHLRSDATEEALQQVAGYVDLAMQRIRERTDTVDSVDIALLTALNLAREVLQLRDQVSGMGGAPATRLRSLIEEIEAELPASQH